MPSICLAPRWKVIFGHRRFTAIYIVGGLFGSLASYAFVDNLSAGASGAIFGLVGALSVYYLRYRDQFGARAKAVLQNMAMIVVVNFIFGLSSPGIDNWGHLGGLLGGAVVAWGLIPRYIPPAPVAFTPQLLQDPRIPLQEEPRTGMEMGWIVICLALIWLGVQAVGRIGGTSKESGVMLADSPPPRPRPRSSIPCPHHPFLKPNSLTAPSSPWLCRR